MAQTLIQQLEATPDGMRLLQQDRTILDLTELICEEMHRQGISRSELAKRLGVTKGYVTQLLDGETNMTLRTASDVLWALNCTLGFRALPRKRRDTDQNLEGVILHSSWSRVLSTTWLGLEDASFPNNQSFEGIAG